jgi:hypothetical protein
VQDVSLTIHELSGEEIAEVEAPGEEGINRAIWDLRYRSLPAVPAGGSQTGRRTDRTGPRGPFVMPGEYLVRLTVAGRRYEKRVQVDEDPRIQVSLEVRRAWTETLFQVADLYRDAVAALDRISPEDSAAAKERYDLTRELIRRISSLYSAMGRWTGPPTEDQKSQFAYFTEMLQKIGN